MFFVKQTYKISHTHMTGSTQEGSEEVPENCKITEQFEDVCQKLQATNLDRFSQNSAKHLVESLYLISPLVLHCNIYL